MILICNLYHQIIRFTSTKPKRENSQEENRILAISEICVSFHFYSFVQIQFTAKVGISRLQRCSLSFREGTEPKIKKNKNKGKQNNWYV